MLGFKTDIVKSREIKKRYRILGGVAILVSAYFIFIDKQDWDPAIHIILGVLYLGGMSLGFGIPFIKPVKKGKLILDNENIEIYKEGRIRSFPWSAIDNVRLQYSGYGSWWSHSIYGNKNYLLITTGEGEKMDLEILVKNKKHKEELKEILNSPTVSRFTISNLLNNSF
ncbi:hypothetical protein FHG64_05510 [Antarcticibacterium flavum]|uniref:Uncharacterized protein n=1 Tax=Antarcticibacterium flavum TaxID=2058175 RepID=A0A5B7X2L4_9FLAO|nr:MULTISPECIES: hypothetical protein [Antarcticibacterium]MCM4159903.1 hypothetical protein [Antarcticibacterium sp. W02-3]QCY68901.1 hypothetical protein FHG64_05510 [Antarcticibacterium flavum]